MPAELFSAPCYHDAQARLIYNFFKNQFNLHANRIKPQVQYKAPWQVYTAWGDDSWAHSSFSALKKDKSVITAYSKWVVVDGKRYQIQAWQLWQNHTKSSLEFFHGIYLYDAGGRMLLTGRLIVSECGGQYMGGDYKDREALRIIKSALIAIMGSSPPIIER